MRYRAQCHHNKLALRQPAIELEHCIVYLSPAVIYPCLPAPKAHSVLHLSLSSTTCRGASLPMFTGIVQEP